MGCIPEQGRPGMVPNRHGSILNGLFNIIVIPVGQSVLSQMLV